jgi:hypothetical protein
MVDDLGSTTYRALAMDFLIGVRFSSEVQYSQFESQRQPIIDRVQRTATTGMLAYNNVLSWVYRQALLLPARKAQAGQVRLALAMDFVYEYTGLEQSTHSLNRSSSSPSLSMLKERLPEKRMCSLGCSISASGVQSTSRI